jgi:hypothetical protein
VIRSPTISASSTPRIFGLWRERGIPRMRSCLLVWCHQRQNSIATSVSTSKLRVGFESHEARAMRRTILNLPGRYIDYELGSLAEVAGAFAVGGHYSLSVSGCETRRNCPTLSPSHTISSFSHKTHLKGFGSLEGPSVSITT